MTASHQSSPLKRQWTTAREYLTHWLTAGLILTLTGFTPDHWVERLVHYLRLPDGFSLFLGVDFRHIAAGVGVTLITGDILYRNWRGRKVSPALAIATPLVAASPLTDANEPIEDKPSIAVLPFVNLSSDPEQEHFADGMTEDIITGLSYDSRLFVIACNSTFAYKGQSPDIREVGKGSALRQDPSALLVRRSELIRTERLLRFRQWNRPLWPISRG